MKKTLLAISCWLLAVGYSYAQFGGFGGFQMPKVELQTSEEFKDVNYAGDDNAYHTCDIYLPKSEAKTFPVVIHIYGSAWFSNSSKGMADLGTIVDALLKAGYAVVCPNHRSSSDAKFPAQINDIKAVIRFVRGNAQKYKFDTSFIATSGFSSGGHLSSLAATSSNAKSPVKVGNIEVDLEGNVGNYLNESSAVNAACDWSGPIDMFRMNCDEPRKWGNTPEEALVGHQYADEFKDQFMSVGATTYIDKNDPPLIVFHGQKDNVVPCCQGQELYDELKKVGVKTELTLEPEGGHGMGMYSAENLQKMVNFLNEARTAPKAQVVEDGGTGKYKAIMKEEAGLEAHTIFCPQDLSQFNEKNPLPVLVWGNGACTNSPWEHYKFLNEIASHGYLVIATGYIPLNGQRYNGPQSTAEQQIESIDWAEKQNKDKNSPYYKKIDTKHIAAAGMSCGGLQTLFNCADKRISTIMICNSGLFVNAGGAMPGMPMPQKSKLKEIKVPIIYILGGEKDIAYNNGMDDFHRIDHVPAFAANYPVGHGGTYGQPHGGEFTVVALNWLNWQSKGDKEAAKMFQGNPCGLSQRKDWTVEKNKLMK